MTLSEEARSRLADIVALQPTKNSELQNRWGVESGSEVHQYLESELKEYYYRDEDSLIRATPDAAELVGVDTDEETVQLAPLQARVLEVVAGPDAKPQSVVSVLHDVEVTGVEATAADVRSALRSLEDRGVVAVVEKTVPTFRLAVERQTLDVEIVEPEVDA